MSFRNNILLYSIRSAGLRAAGQVRKRIQAVSTYARAHTCSEQQGGNFRILDPLRRSVSAVHRVQLACLQPGPGHVQPPRMKLFTAYVVVAVILRELRMP